MKITKSQLKQIIKEEMSSTLKEDGHTDVPSAARKLKAAVEDATNILAILDTHPDANLPSWWMSKITLASDYLNKARDYSLYDGRPMQGEMNETASPMDFSKGKDPAVSQTPDMAPAPVEEPEESSIGSLSDLFYKILNSPDGTLTLNKKDATMVAGLIAPYAPENK